MVVWWAFRKCEAEAYVLTVMHDCQSANVQSQLSLQEHKGRYSVVDGQEAGNLHLLCGHLIFFLLSSLQELLKTNIWRQALKPPVPEAPAS